MTQVLAPFIYAEQCPLCGSKDHKSIHEETNHFPKKPFFEAYRLDVVHLERCGACGFAFVDKLPADKEYYSQLYESVDYDYAYEFEYHGKRKIFADTRKRIKRYVNGGTLLDVGTWCGTFLQFMKDDFECKGVEISESAVKYARSRGLDVVNKSFDEAGFSDSMFDVVTLIDVLEHLPEPRSVLESLHRMLKPGGVIYIKVPNYIAQLHKQNVLKSLRLSREGIMQNYVHINHFSRPALSKCLESMGFEVLEAGFAKAEIWDLRSEKFPPATALKHRLANVARQSITGFFTMMASITGRETGFNLFVLAKKK